ncbi:MAG TPA: lysophospholipid acyltransferase family protein [Gemmatimonadaceae bacterium]|jgi:1-acyl-sn-glycerol-3-phosphate acyltransferase|nr:lysophospholipid acyltransferase family protein [Gemmatimonadaceae bacterium]
MSRVLLWFRVAATFILMTIGAFVMLIVAIPTLFLARRFYSEVMARALGAMVLRLWGVRYRGHGAPQPASRQTVYIANHSSTLDLFVLIALGLPRTRFFLSGFLRKVPPIGIVGSLIRIFWTVPQEFPNERRAIFKRAARILRQTGDSVFLSPEGKRVTTGDIGKFNKGSFHLATSLGAPIVPMYFAVPRAIDPGMGYDAKPGVLDVYFLPPIDTSDWTVDEVEQHRDDVRALYVRVHHAVRETGALPASLLLEDAPLMEEALA